MRVERALLRLVRGVQCGEREDFLVVRVSLQKRLPASRACGRRARAAVPSLLALSVGADALEQGVRAFKLIAQNLAQLHQPGARARLDSAERLPEPRGDLCLRQPLLVGE